VEVVRSLVVSEDVAQALVGALLAIARADGELNNDEIAALRRVAAELCGVRIVDEQLLLVDDVSPDDLAALLAGGDGPYRGMRGDAGTGGLGPAFTRAAIQIALADGDVSEVEAALIVRFARGLGVGVDALDREAALRPHALSDPPDDAGRLLRLLVACRRSRDWEGVLSVLERIVSLTRRPTRIARLLSAMGVVCRDRLAAAERALALFRAALREDPFSQPPLEHATRLLVGQGRDDEAAALETNVILLRRRAAERLRLQ
jgi:tellurite resistance protein